MSEVIPCLISKDDGKGNFCKADKARIEKVNQDCANTLTCHEPSFSVHHCNMAIVAMCGRNPDNPSDRTPGKKFEQGLVPNSKGICNTLTTVQKDNLVLEETIKIKQATKQGYIECKNGGVADFSFPDSKTRRGRVEQNGEVSPTLMAGNNEIVKIEKNGFYEQAIKTAEENNAQEGDIVDAFNHKVLKDGISPTITTRPEGKKTAILPVVKNNKIEKVGQISNEGSQCGTVVSPEGLYPTISAGCHGYANPHITQNYRIRKLTPRECWRLMGFSDTDFEAAEKVNSNTQLYKQAGNSIVKNVLMAIFKQMVG